MVEAANGEWCGKSPGDTSNHRNSEPQNRIDDALLVSSYVTVEPPLHDVMA
jgi:hypothetical protein